MVLLGNILWTDKTKLEHYGNYIEHKIDTTFQKKNEEKNITKNGGVLRLYTFQLQDLDNLP